MDGGVVWMLARGQRQAQACWISSWSRQAACTQVAQLRMAAPSLTMSKPFWPQGGCETAPVTPSRSIG
eukprot:363217-Chlamydomonas_euryale.AAC.8